MDVKSCHREKTVTVENHSSQGPSQMQRRPAMGEAMELSGWTASQKVFFYSFI